MREECAQMCYNRGNLISKTARVFEAPRAVSEHRKGKLSMSTSDSTTSKCCGRKDDCLHPDGPWLPASAEYFTKNKLGKYGLHSRCKACDRAHKSQYEKQQYAEVRKQRYLNHHSERLAAQRVYYRLNADRVKAYQSAYRDIHRNKLRARDRAFYQSNPARRRPLSSDKMRAKNFRRRARLTACQTHVSGTDILAQLKSQGGKCWWCGKSVGDNYHADHRVPLAKGGANSPDNICIACPPCNLSKGAKMPWEFNGRLL